MPYGTLNADTITNSNGLSGNAIGPGFKNRIINGDMRIDQRNAGAAVTVNTAARTYGVDRFFGFGQATDGVFTIDQDTVAPTGFVNSTKVTTTTADASVGASQFYLFSQSIEGTNVADLAWGTASAKTVTLSFWVRSSLTGTFGGALLNGAANRSYPFTYSISVADTWEYKTVTIAGDTTGTWLTTAGTGLQIYWDLGSGSSNIGTAGSWSGSAFYGATGGTKLISTLNATWYVTGVQLEVGPSATSFDYRPFGTELALCQRYYEKSYRQSVAVPTNSSLNGFANSFANKTLTGSATNERAANIVFNTSKRAAPTITFYTLTSSTAGSWEDGGGNAIAMLTNGVSETAFIAYNNANVATNTGLSGHWVASIEL